MNIHHKECLRLLSTLESHITSEQYYNALTVNTVLQKYLLWALAGEMPVEVCKVPKYAEACSCGRAPYIDETDSEKTRIHCPRCLKKVTALTKRDAIEDWNNAVYAFKANKLFPKRCTCGSVPHCDTVVYDSHSADTFRVKCLLCKKFITAESIEHAIEAWNDTMEDYIEPVKEKCGNCKYWLRHDEEGVLPEGNCRHHCLYNERNEYDWCGDWNNK